MPQAALLPPSQWLRTFLERRGLTEPDRRMLFAYRLTDEEFVSLCELLGPGSAIAELWLVAININGFPQAFVLFAAEWWRRYYSGGAWSWERIFSAISARADDWAPPVRNQCIQQGLAAWGHGTSVGGRRYIGAIARQGGFPLPLVAEASGELPAIIRLVLRRAARIGAEFEEILAMVREQGVRLPVSLQADEMYELIASTVDSILRLRREFNLRDESTAVQELDTRCPDWRDQFPLPLDNAAAQALLQGFVRAAVESSRIQGQVALIEVDRILRAMGPGAFALQTRLRFPGEIGAEPLAAYLSMAAEDLPFRLGFRVELGASTAQIDARKKLSQPSFSLTATADHWSGPLALREVTMTASVSGNAFDRRTVPGGDELDPDLPWYFVEDGGAYRLIGLGSVRTRLSMVLAALPDNAEIADIPPEQVAWIGAVDLENTPRRVCRLAQDCAIALANGDRFAVRLVQAGAEEEQLVWSGRRFPYPTKPGLCFYGPPHLDRILADGEKVRVPWAELHWRPVGSPNAQPSAPTEPGVYDVAWLSRGETRTRFRVAILPPQSNLQFRSLPQLGQGEIKLKALRARQVTVQSALESECVRSEDGSWSVMVRTTGDPPASIPVVLDWPTSTGSLVCDLPFPANGGRFADATGAILSDGVVLGLGRLAGCSLRIFDTNPDRPQGYKLKLQLVEPRNHGAAHRDIEREVSITLEPSNTALVRLVTLQEDIESLLTLSDAADARVRVLLIAGTTATSKVHVSRFEAAMRIVDGCAELPVTGAGAADLTQARVVAFSLGDPQKELVELPAHTSEGVPTGRWTLDDLSVTGTPWLLAPAPSSTISFRPTIFAPPPPSDVIDRDGSSAGASEEATAADLTVAAADASPQRRAVLYREVWSALAKDHGAPDWDHVERIWEALAHIPLSCLDLWRAVADHPTALVAILLHPWNRIGPEPRANLLKRLVRDVGVVWELVPLSDWIAGLRQLYQFCTQLVGDEAGLTLYQGMQEELAVLVTAQTPGLRTLLPLASRLAAGQPVPRGNVAKAACLRRELYDGAESLLQNELLRQHTEDAWPRFRLFDQALKAFFDEAPRPIAERLQAHRQTLFAFQFMNDHKSTVIHSPVLLAVTALTGHAAAFWREPEVRWHVMQQRAFDPEWFTIAFDYGVQMSLAVELVNCVSPAQ